MNRISFDCRNFSFEARGPDMLLANCFYNNSFHLRLDLHIIIAVQFTDVEFVAEIKHAAADDSEYVVMGSASQNVIRAEDCPTTDELIRFNIELSDQSYSCPLEGVVCVRLTVRLCGRLGQVNFLRRTMQMNSVDIASTLPRLFGGISRV